MTKDIGKFQIPMKDFMLVQVLEPMDKFTHNIDSFILSDVFPLLNVRIKITFVTVFHDQIEIV
jgi:hypothetical protein